MNEGRDQVKYLLDQVPGGDVGVTVIFLLSLIIFSLLLTRGRSYSGPVTMVAVIAGAGLLGAAGITSGPIMVVLIALAVLIGVTMLRVSQAR
ncbi:MAG: hypothetical protein J4F46_09290 [Dehalococcoidia bacterium]|nr:hypothetical protein [Dehalococcoidia bacterium]